MVDRCSTLAIRVDSFPVGKLDRLRSLLRVPLAYTVPDRLGYNRLPRSVGDVSERRCNRWTGYDDQQRRVHTRPIDADS